MVKVELNLHSTMFLLNPIRGEIGTDIIVFTFHYVSIKSKTLMVQLAAYINLHSTMFLLNPELRVVIFNF